MSGEQHPTERLYRVTGWTALLSVAVVVALLAAAGVLASGAATAQSQEIDSPAIAYVEPGDNGAVSFVTADGTQFSTGVHADFIGPLSDLTRDGTVEVPAIRSGRVLLISPDGSTTVLDGSGNAGGDVSALTIGDYDNDGTTEILYPRNSRVYTVEPGGQPAAVTGQLGDGIGGVVGYGKFNADANGDLVIVDGSQNVQYLDNFGAGGFDGVVDASIGIGSNNGLGTGPLVDFDGDGVNRLAAIDGSQNVVLYDSNGNEQNVYTSNYQNAKKAPVGVADIDGDGTLDVVHMESSNNIFRGPWTGGSPQAVTDASDSLIPANTKSGIAGTAVGTLDAREAIVYESSVVKDPGSTVQVTFNNTVTVTDPAQAVTEFSLTVDGSPAAVTGVTGGGASDTLNVSLADKVRFDQSVTVSYNGSAESLGGADDGFRVEGFTDRSVTNNVSEPANFTVTVSGVNAPIVAGETLVVTATVANTGERTATQDIVLRNFTDGVTDTTPLELDGGESKTVDLTWSTDTPDAGTGSVTVTSSNDSATETLKIDGNRPDGITIETPPGNTTAGDSITGPPAVKVTDQIDEPLANATVTVATTVGGALGGQTQVVTDGSGIAVFDSIQITEAGSYALTFTVENVSVTSDSFYLSPAAVDSVEMSPASDQIITAGETVEFSATAFDQFDNVVESSDSAFSWSASGGSISGDGLFDETGADETGSSYDVTAELGGTTSSATTVTVQPAAVDSVEISPASDQTVVAGEDIAFDATAFDEFNNIVESATSAFSWSGIQTPPTFTNRTAGVHEVSATLGGVSSATTTVTVEPAGVSTVELSPGSTQTVASGESINFSATAVDEFGNLVTDTDTDFSWTNTTATGSFSEETTGSYDVSATLGGVAATVTVVVETSDVDSITLSPASDQTVTAGESIPFNATALDEFGNVVETTNTAFNWTNTGTTGTFSKTVAGTYSVTASLGGVTAPTRNVTVEPDAVSSIDLVPSADQTVAAGEFITLDATALDQFGNLITDNNNAFTWNNTNTNGVFGKETVGTYEVTATLNGVTSSPTTVIVEAGSVGSVEITPEKEQTVEAGSSISFDATAFDEFGNLVTDDNSAFSWSGIQTPPTFDNQTAGVYSVSATLDGVSSATTTVTVEPASVDSVELSPAGDQTVTVGEPVEFSATAVDEFGNLVTDTDTGFAWQNTTSNGSFSERTAGTYVVTATRSGVTSAPTTVTVEPGEVDSVELDPASGQTVEAGTNIEFNATAFDAFDNVVETDNNAFSWANATTGTFSEDTVGSYRVSATLNGVSTDVTVTVEPGQVSSIELSPATDQTVTAGRTVEFDATAFDAFDNVVTDDNSSFTWEHTDTAGVFSRTAAGTYSVTATLNGVESASTAVTVEPGAVDLVQLSPGNDQTVTAGDSVGFDAEAFDEFGNLVTDTDTDFTWANTTVTGSFSRETVGTYVVTASLDGSMAAVTVTVEAGSVSDVSVSPGDSTVTAGKQVEFSAAAVDEFGNLVTDTDTDFTWTGTDPMGTFNRTTAGTYDVTAGLNGQNAESTVTVEPAAVESVELTPPSDQTVQTGESIEFDAAAFDGFGNLVTNTDADFTWTNTTATGSFSESTTGTYIVTATRNGVTASVTVTVDSRTASSIELTPSDGGAVEAGGSVEFSATAKDEFGNVIETNDSVFTWTNAEGGVFSEETAGSYDVAASLDGVTTTTTVVVEPGPVAAATLSPGDPKTVTAGGSLAFDATATDEFGNVVTDSETAFTWTNANSMGTFSQESAGRYNVTAAYDGVTVTVPVTVEPGSVESVVLSPAESQTIEAGTTLQFHATALDAFGNVVETANTAFNWTNTDDNGSFSRTTASSYKVTVGLNGVTHESTTVTVKPSNVSTVETTPVVNQTVAAGETVAFDATATDEFGNIIETDDTAFTWTSNAEGGVFSEETAGTYDVAASIDGVSSSTTTVTVEAADVASVELSPAGDQTVVAGEPVDFSATAFDEFGNVVTDTDTEFSWTNTDQTGLFNRTEPGTYQVIATVSGRTAVVTVTVETGDVATVGLSPAGDQTVGPTEIVEFDATADDAFGNVVEDTDSMFNWSTGVDGVFSREMADTYNVTATLDGVTSAPTTVTVEPGAVDTVELSPGDQTVEAGETVEFSATALDGFGNLVTDNDTDFGWSNASQTGLFGETTAGSYRVVASLDGSAVSATVTVEAGDVSDANSTVELSPGDQTITAGSTVDFDAVAVDEFGNVIEDSDTAFNWTNTTEAGLFDETTAGSYEVTVTFDGVTASATVTVEAADVATGVVELSPESSQTVDAGKSLQFSATAKDTFGNVIETNNTAFNWSNASEGGQFSETAAGSYEVTASLNGSISAPTTVTVEPGDIGGSEGTVNLTPTENQTELPAGVVDFDATALDEFGNVVESDDIEFNWTNTTDSGVFSENTPGTYRVTASLNGTTAAPTFVTVNKPDTFLVDIQNGSEFVEKDDIEVTATITNAGEVAATQTVELRVVGLGTDQVEMTLGPGESRVQTFAVGTEAGDAGSYAATVESEDESDSTSVRVFELTDVLEVSSVDLSAAVEVGTDIQVGVEVTNTGNATGFGALTVDAGVLDSADVTIGELEPGETTVTGVTLETVSQPSHVGEHDLSIALDGNRVVSERVEVFLPAIAESFEPPNDTDGDDRYEDANGGGEFSIFDVQDFFTNINADTVNEHAWAYDFNEDGNANIFDVQALFNEL